MCLVNITTTFIKFTYLMNVNCVIGQATPILTHSSTNVICFGVKKLRPPKREQNARPHLLFTSTLLNYRVSKIQVPFLKSYFLLLLGQYFQNLCVWFNPGTGDNHIILLVDQNSAHIAHTSQMFKITQYFSYLE